MISKVVMMAKPQGFNKPVEVDSIGKAQFIRIELPDSGGHFDISEQFFRNDGHPTANGITVRGSKSLRLEELTLNLCNLKFKE